MRSRVVFQAREVIGNRYQLCGICASGTKKLHTRSDRIQDTINTVLAILGGRDKGDRSLSRNSPISEEELDWIYEIKIEPCDFATIDSRPFLQSEKASNAQSAGRLSLTQLNQRAE